MSTDKFVYSKAGELQEVQAPPPSPQYIAALKRAVEQIEDPDARETAMRSWSEGYWKGLYAMLNDNGVMLPLGK